MLSSHLQDRAYRAEVAGAPRDGRMVSAHQGNEWSFIVSPTPESYDGAGPYQTWEFQVEFAP